MQLANVLTGIQRGTNMDREGWCWEITGLTPNAPDQAKAGSPVEQPSSLDGSWSMMSSLKTFIYLVSPLGVYQGLRRGLWK